MERAQQYRMSVEKSGPEESSEAEDREEDVEEEGEATEIEDKAKVSIQSRSESKIQRWTNHHHSLEDRASLVVA